MKCNLLKVYARYVTKSYYSGHKKFLGFDYKNAQTNKNMGQAIQVSGKWPEYIRRIVFHNKLPKTN